MTVAAYRNQSTGQYPISVDQLRSLVNFLFGEKPEQELLEQTEYDPVLVSPKPVFNENTHYIVEGEPVVNSMGFYEQSWNLISIPPVPVVVPNEISDRQFSQILAIKELITRDEAKAFVSSGVIPERLKEAVDHIEDDDKRFAAEMLLSGATIFKRNHPLTPLIGSLFGMNSDAIDELWIQASAL